VTVLLLAQKGTLRAEQPHVLHRLATRLRSDHLTRRLAGGASPESSMLLALLAQRLVSASHRTALADELGALVTVSSQASASGRPGWPPVSWAAVAEAASDLLAVVERLRRPGPVGVRGVAIVEQLLRDGAGPMYYATDPGELVAQARAAVVALDH
jgi:hypothetical protein